MVQELESWGVKFQKTASGDYDVKKLHHKGSYVLPIPEARVLVNRPHLLLMDEPFSALDARRRVADQPRIHVRETRVHGVAARPEKASLHSAQNSLGAGKLQVVA
jgi:hypothetical protein